ncbi:hypothetical protein QTO34_007109, partial [Cnephaeus nilssonii]
NSEKEEDDSEKREDPGDNWEEGGGGGGGVEKSSGPWNKTAPVQAPPAPVTETPEPAMTSGVYRPPGARLTTTRKTPQGPPEIYSDTQFPSLQSTAKHVESRKDKEMEKSFEVVRHKTRGRDEVSKNQALKLQLDNQYTVLENQTNSHTQREKESRKQASQNPTGKVPFGVFRPEARVAALETGFPPPCQAPARRAPKV